MTLVSSQPSVTEPFPSCPERRLGAVVSPSGTQFALWAPSACKVTLRLFSHGSENEFGNRMLVSYPMFREMDGSWVLNFEDNKHGVYYDYLVEFPCGTVNRTADPWANAAGVNGRRSMVVDLSRTNPDGWENDRRPNVPVANTMVWETHIGDFSNDPRGGFPAEHRGKFLAFTDTDTSLDGLGEYPTGVAYLRKLGVTAVQLLPFYDYGSVDEAGSPQFNWGYDPVNYNVPEGSYSTNPFDGSVRIRECKSMIHALHKAGIAVIMDVVYNHMFSSDNWFERTVPGYFCRRKPNGALANGSACGCDMATERTMFRKFIIESVTYWAREYHVDGFRFDLMGLIDTETMNQVRAALDSLPDGESILMYGEPWAAGPTSVPDGTILADKQGLRALSTRIGHFCDTTRDAVKGHVFYAERAGYVNGDAAGNRDAIACAVDAWRKSLHDEGVAGQVIQYVSAHDDLTLWDKLCLSMMPDGGYARTGVSRGADPVTFGTEAVARADAADAADDAVPVEVFDVHSPQCAPMLEANRIAAGLIFTAAGIPFCLAGEEFARTKFGDEDSYDSGIDINLLDWSRSARLSALTDYYAALIALRKADPRWFDGERQLIALDNPSGISDPSIASHNDVCAAVVAYRVGQYVVFANPDNERHSVPVRLVDENIASISVTGDGGSASSASASSTSESNVTSTDCSIGRAGGETGLDAAAVGDCQSWHCVLDSTQYTIDGIEQTATCGATVRRDMAGDWFELPARSFTVWKW